MRKLLCLFLVVGLFVVTGCGKEEKKPCEPLSGGSYTIIFETNDDNPIQNMNVCIACGPDAYEDLPVLESDDKTFDGWYFDPEFGDKVTATNSMDIVPRAKYDKDDEDCVIGYNNVTLYAKWIENAE